MAQLRQQYDQFKARGAEVIVVGPDSTSSVAKFWREHDIPFIGLPDPNGRVLKLYGQEVNLLKLGRMPALMVVDQHGIVRFVHYSGSMADIPSNQQILSVLDKVNNSTSTDNQYQLI